jgi:penicillin G amidase
MKKWLKRFAKLIGILALVLLIALAVYVYRAFPSLSGEAKLAGLGSEVSIRRDASDVTHIEGKSSLDVWHALGYTHAQERSWQLEFNRRVMHGELSEVLGAATLETDKLMRTLGIIPAAKAQLANYPPAVRAALEAYADGINGFHASNAGVDGQALPPEFHILGLKPGKWEAADSVGWALMMALDLGGNWGAEFTRLSLLQNLNTQELWQMMPPYKDGQGVREAAATQVDLAKLYQDLDVYVQTKQNQKVSQHAPQAIPDVPSQTIPLQAPWRVALGKDVQDWASGLGQIDSRGSNNWVISGSHTASGKPILANDPHLALSSPAVWYFARLKSPEFDVIGATLPGIPFVILGRTSSAAWGFTNTGPDTQDLYLEQIDPANAAQYKTPMGMASFVQRSEVIKIKGQGAVTHVVRSTRHGPVLSDAQKSYDPILNKSKYALALRWAALDADNVSLVAAFNASSAKNVAELRAAFEFHHSPMQNIVMADTSGQTLYKAAGKVPLRHANDDIKGMSPSLGWEAKYDWVGWLPYDKTPEQTQAVIDKTGWMATANARIHAADYPYFMGQDWAAPHRQNRIEQLLGSAAQHSVASTKADHADHVSLAAQLMLKTLKTVPSDHPMAAAAQTQLKSYDGKMSTDSVAATLVNLWTDQLTRDLMGDKVGADKFKTLYGKRQFRQGLEELLDADQGKGHKAWCAPQSCQERYTAAWDATLNKLGDQYGKDISLWTWGKLHPAISSHRPFSNVSVLKNLFTVSSPSHGDPFTVNVGQYYLAELDRPFANRHAPSLRAIYDLADLEQSQFIYQTGQSGLVFSGRYRSMADEWSNVKYRNLSMNTINFTNNLKLIP